ncbi:MAG: PIG-L family deacetylase [Oligoflexus sp.]
MTQNHYNLIVVAHPDDESLFFAGLVLQKRQIPWHVVCVTDANADGRGDERRDQFALAMQELGVNDWQWLGLPDVYEKRLDLSVIISMLADRQTPQSVYTHGPTGEYMHPHHQDVSMAVHRLWAEKLPVYSVAYNCRAEQTICLSAAHYAKKCQILGQIYGQETIRFANFLPAGFCEGFSRISLSEVQAIYRRLSGQSASLAGVELPFYEWLRFFLEQRASQGNPRPF